MNKHSFSERVWNKSRDCPVYTLDIIVKKAVVQRIVAKGRRKKEEKKADKRKKTKGRCSSKLQA